MSTYSEQINVVIQERLLPKMRSISTEIANIEPYSYSSSELEDLKRQLNYYSMIYDFLVEYEVGSEELDNTKLVNIVRLLDSPTTERKSSNYLTPKAGKISKANTGYKLFLDRTEVTDDTVIKAGSVINLTAIYTDSSILTGDKSIQLTSGTLFEVSDGFTISIQNKVIPLSSDGSTLTIFVRAFVNGIAANAGQTFIIPIGNQLEVANDVDGNQYTVMQIGTKKWMLEDLKTTKYSDGSPIPNISGFNDWFMPSKDELNKMWVNLKSGIDENSIVYTPMGGFTIGFYESSSENNAFTFWKQSFLTGVQTVESKGSSYGIRACRAFTSLTVYNLRDLGPAGGYIFYKSGNDYLECTPVDQSLSYQWSTIPGSSIGTTGTAIGTGQANTTAIVAQGGTSAAGLCNNLTSNLIWSTLITGAYCWNNNDISNKTLYGALYNWFAVNDNRNIAPIGWHVATKQDWIDLQTYLGGNTVAGGKLKEAGTSHWIAPNTGATDDVKFAAVPAGFRYGYDGTFYPVGNVNYLWTADQFDIANSTMFSMDNTHAGLFSANFLKTYGLSVRCVKN